MKWITNIPRKDRWQYPKLHAGQPKATSKMIIEELKREDMIGIYSDDDDNQDQSEE